MPSSTSWKVVPFAACLSIIGACGTAPEGTSTEEMSAPPVDTAGRSAPPMGAAGSAGKPAAGAAGMKAPSAGSSAGSAGAGGTSAVRAVAMLEPFMAAATSAGAAGAGGGSAGASSSAGSGGAAGSVGSSAGSSAAGVGGGGTGAGAGIAALSGTATFTNAGSTQVDLNIEVSGCEDGKSYPVHIHEGTSCESAETQGAHWGETQAFMISAAGAGGSSAAGSGGSAAGSAGHGGSHAGAGGSDAGAAGSAGAAGRASPATSFKFRGEGISDIKCTGTTGTTVAKRNSFDKRVTWSIGTGTEDDVVGHVVVVHDGSARIACGKIELK